MSEQREIDGAASEGAAKGSAQAGSMDEADRPDPAESEEAVGAAPRDQPGNAWSGRAVGPLSRLLPGGSVDPLVGDEPVQAAEGDPEPVGQRPEDAREFAEPGSAAESEPVPGTASAEGQPDDAAEVPEPDETAGVTEDSDALVAVTAAEASEPFEAVVVAETGRRSAEDRWHGVLAGFVDDPRGSVEAASALIDEDIARHFVLLAQHKESMHAWRADVDADTEALRISLVNYRDLRKRLADVATVLSR
jgi:hypothetical protein